MGTGEFAAIDRIRRLFPDAPPGQVWIGDDAAVLEGGLLAAADALSAGVHFGPDQPLDDVGWRVVAVNVSDIAAMGGRPTALLVTVVAPAATDLDRLYAGIAEASATFGCPVVGGDLANGRELVVSVTVLGTADGRAPVLRSGARAGDPLWVTGPLGAAAVAGYRDRPHPRLAEGIAAAERGATAMIDVSDGLAADLGHVLDASRVGAAVHEVPCAPGATLAQALNGGEDYELVIAAPPDVDLSDVAVAIGECTADLGQRPWPAAGWEHDFA